MRPGSVAEGASAMVCTSRSEEHTSELQSQSNLVCRLLLEKKKNQYERPVVSPPATGEVPATAGLPVEALTNAASTVTAFILKASSSQRRTAHAVTAVSELH